MGQQLNFSAGFHWLVYIFQEESKRKGRTIQRVSLSVQATLVNKTCMSLICLNWLQALPSGMGRLSSLTRLDLSSCSRLEVCLSTLACLKCRLSFWHLGNQCTIGLAITGVFGLIQDPPWEMWCNASLKILDLSWCESLTVIFFPNCTYNLLHIFATMPGICQSLLYATLGSIGCIWMVHRMGLIGWLKADRSCCRSRMFQQQLES